MIKTDHIKVEHVSLAIEWHWRKKWTERITT